MSRPDYATNGQKSSQFIFFGGRDHCLQVMYTKNTYIYYKLEGTENILKTYQIKALQVE